VTRRTQHRVGPEHSSRVCRRTPSDRLQGVCGVLHVCMGRARWQMQRCATPECAVWRGRSFSISAAGDNHLQLHPQRARSSRTRDLVDQRWPPPLHARPRPDLSLHRTEGPLARLPMTTQAQGALISQQRRHGQVRTAAIRLGRDRRTGKYTPHELSKSHQTPLRRPRRASEPRLADMLPDLLPLACRLGVSHLMGASIGTAPLGHAGRRVSAV
jgi:hypothetical protein